MTYKIGDYVWLKNQKRVVRIRDFEMLEAVNISGDAVRKATNGEVLKYLNLEVDLNVKRPLSD